ncbi:hypothetical protein EUX98_g2937 [Antrodiella citrinella]|uniref:F-box domain-containing protein n=1 Tax=Antrodiella citrinella TaxID=2447956 RepID=A0A4S4N634_9APHY|nr:hypothetical protein EUX98_g2937 [Antrodiella citrinella]
MVASRSPSPPTSVVEVIKLPPLSALSLPNDSEIVDTRLPRGVPIEVWDMIIDIVAQNDRNTKDQSLLCCFLVCRAWIPRCRFHLPVTKHVDLYSRDDLEDFGARLTAYPHLASKVDFLFIYGRKAGDTSIDDMWVSSIPVMLPPLPNLTSLSIYDIDFAHQHPDLPKLFSKLFLGTFKSGRVDLTLIRVSFLHFVQVSRLAHATRAQSIRLMGCPLSIPIANRTALNRLPSRNMLLAVTEMHIDLTSELSELINMPSHWLPAYPNLHKLRIQFPLDRDGSFIQNAQAWSRLGVLFQRLVSRSVQPNDGSDMSIFNPQRGPLNIQMTGGVSGREPKLTLKGSTYMFGLFISEVVKALPQLSPGQFRSVEVDLGFSGQCNWDDNTPKLFQAVDNAISFYCPFLTHFKMKLSRYAIPYHVFKRQYGCDDNLRDAWFPRMAQTGIIERECVNGNCFIHESIRK